MCNAPRLIEAYRDTEVTQVHPLSLVICKLQQNGMVAHPIKLTLLI